MDELGKSFPAAEGMVDAEENTTKTHVNENCLNCGTPLIDTFCHHCGQKDIPRRQTVGDMLANFISSFWSYEGKFILTTKYIITRPGFLPLEYNAGRRESYYHPARMYVFISFVFFLLYFSIPDQDDTDADKLEMTDEDIGELREDLKDAGLDTGYWRGVSDSVVIAQAPAVLDSIRKANPKKGNGFSLTSAEYESVEKYDSAQMAAPPDERHGWLMRRLSIRTIELNQKYKNDGDKFKQDFGTMFKDNFSKVLFWLLPFFALVLKLLYVRRDFYYSEHLVMTIYYYNFFFLAGSAIMLVDLIPGLGFVSTVLAFWIYLYFLFAMKRMYMQSWSKTILKFILFSGLFSLFMLTGVIINILVIVMIL